MFHNFPVANCELSPIFHGFFPRFPRHFLESNLSQELKRAIRGEDEPGETGGTAPSGASGASTPKSPRTPAARLRRAKSVPWRWRRGVGKEQCPKALLVDD